jgi:hypothetical protein
LQLLGTQSGNYQAQFSPMNITAEEQIGLEAVLRVTATVADKVYAKQQQQQDCCCSSSSSSNTGSISNDPSWTSRKNSLELIQLSSMNKVRLSFSCSNTERY